MPKQSHIPVPALVALNAVALPMASDGNVPEWADVLPVPDAQGRVTGIDGRTWFARNAAAIIQRTQQHLPIPLDVNHSTELAARVGGESPARGWIEELRVAANGAIQGRVRWLESGRNAVQTLEYRYLSPVITYDQSGNVTGITSVALTNTPNFTALALNAAAITNGANMDLTEVLAALGLPATATAADILSVVKTLIAKATEYEQTAANSRQELLTKYVPIGNAQALEARATAAETKLAEIEKKALNASIDAALNSASNAGKITPASREHYQKTIRTAQDLQQFNDLVAVLPVIVPPTAADASALNAVGAGTPAAGVASHGRIALNAEQQNALNALKAMGITEDEFRKANGLA